MKKIFKIVFIGAIMCLFASLIAGCGSSDHFAGRWIESKALEGSVLEAGVIEITPNGNNEYLCEYSKYYYDSKTNESEKHKWWQGSLKRNTENTIQSPENPGILFIYNVEKKCIQFNPGNELKDYTLANDDKALGIITANLKKGHEESERIKAERWAKNKR